MKILFITQWFQPEHFYKGVPFAKALMEKGHQVQVLTGFPNYPMGKLYPGYKIKFFQKEAVEGVDVVRVPLYPSHDRSPIGRVTNYLSFAFFAFILGPWLLKKPDVIYVYHPPPTTYIPALVLKLLYRVPVVYDIQDFWPDTLSATGMFKNQFGLKLVDGYCRLFYKAADKIVVLCPGFKKKLIEKGVPVEKIEIIYNWFDEKNLTAKPNTAELPDILCRPDTFKILFAGNMGKAQGLESVLEAAKILKDSNPKIQFIFIGGGVEVENLKAKAGQMELSNVHFLPYVPPKQIGSFLQVADVLLVHLKKNPLFEITIPSKIQAYLAAGKPILVAVPGDAAEIVRQAEAGFECPSEDPAALAQAAIRLGKMPPDQLKQLGQNGKQFYWRKMAMPIGVEQFDQLFQNLLTAQKTD